MANKVGKALTHPRDLLVYAMNKLHIGQSMSDENYLKMIYRIKFGKKLDLEHPVTFNEKLQWLKLHDHNPLYPTMVDKITAKDYVASIIGSEYIIPTLKVYGSVADIQLEELPDQFVLKTNHSGGNSGVVICSDKKKFDLDAAKKKLLHSLESDMFSHSREWPYTQIKPQVFAEKFMTEGSGAPEEYKVHNFNGVSNNLLSEESPVDRGLADYKFFCFNGVVRALFIGTERNTGDVKFDFYDADFNHLDLVQTHPMSGHELEKPENFEKMKEIAGKLSKGLPHIRVDLYNISGKIYFGELTFYHHGGFYPFHPEKWDKIFGDWLQLPNVCNEN